MQRRAFLGGALGGAAAWAAAARAADKTPAGEPRFGLVTYLWARDWDLPSLIARCESTGCGAVELRVDHAHGVSPALPAEQRREVRKRFADSSVLCLGPGTNEDFDDPDPAEVRASLERTKAWLQLSHDIGGSGVKVKPNDFHEGVEKEKTLEQIGRALRELGPVADGLGQELRLEVHGQCAPLPHIRRIMEASDHPRVRVCWNSNGEDLQGEGLEANFRSVRDWFGDTVHVRELDVGDYPYQRLLELLVGSGYRGWVLLEARTEPADRVAALAEQRKVFERMLAEARKTAGA